MRFLNLFCPKNRKSYKKINKSILTQLSEEKDEFFDQIASLLTVGWPKICQMCLYMPIYYQVGLQNTQLILNVSIMPIYSSRVTK